MSINRGGNDNRPRLGVLCHVTLQRTQALSVVVVPAVHPPIADWQNNQARRCRVYARSPMAPFSLQELQDNLFLNGVELFCGARIV